MLAIGVYSYGTATLTFLTFFFLIIFKWRQRTASLELSIAMLFGAIWSLSATYDAYEGIVTSIWSVGLEILRNLVWGYLLLKLIRLLTEAGSSWFRTLERLTYSVPILFLGLLLFVSSGDNYMGQFLGFDIRIIGNLLMSLIGLVLVEQVFRASIEQRWAFKFVCIGFIGIYGYEFYAYAEALLFRAFNINAWDARGFIVAISTVLVGIGIGRIPVSSASLRLSRPLVFYASAVVFAGVYLLIVAGGGYYLMLYGGDWGTVIRNTFIFAALLLLLLVVTSGTMRGRLRVYIDKHFLNYKYDYREEWLRLIRQLSSEPDPSRLEEKAVQALADMMDSEGGALWVRGNNRKYTLSAKIGSVVIDGTPSVSDSMLHFLELWQWVINVDEFHSEPELYQDLNLPEWVTGNERVWLVVPLMLQAELYGFVVLGRPRADREFNWEDIDLLKTAGRQVAIHLAQAHSALALVEARQFEAFNRLSAYVMHDLKNLMSQLGLVVKNAEKHKANPAFVDDAINTVENAVERMNRLLAQLKSGALSSEKKEKASLHEVLHRVVKDKSKSLPRPELDLSGDVEVEADRERLISVIGHVVQNAQDATPSTGYVKLILSHDQGLAVIEIKDDGKGMDQDFIQNRLFRPFDSTKGLTGMGIGAHEVRQFIEELGGTVDVYSEIDRGTTFRLKIPSVKSL